jgi:hypothetical protein
LRKVGNGNAVSLPQNHHDRDLRDVTITPINCRETARRRVLISGNINSDATRFGIIPQSVTLPLIALICPRLVLLSRRLRWELRVALLGLRLFGMTIALLINS